MKGMMFVKFSFSNSQNSVE